MKTIPKSIIFLFALQQILLGQTDVEGSADHPLITRYPGSIIEWTDRQAFDQYKIPIAPVTGYRHIEDWLAIEGNLHRIYYVLRGDNTLSEVYANYLQAIRDAGFEIIVKGLHTANNVAKEIGGRTWLQVLYRENPLPAVGKINLLSGSSTLGGSAYLAAKLERAEGTVYVSLGGSQYKQDEVVFMLDILEEETVEDELLHVDANAMSKDIEIYGKVALYGIFFDHDKASIKPESKSALDEIAKLLSDRPELELYVVGHTDMTGTLNYNLKLSEDRARSVVKALTDDYGIDSKRLTPKGVGPLVPVYANQSEQGRAKNRRVELVQR